MAKHIRQIKTPAEFDQLEDKDIPSFYNSDFPNFKIVPS